VTTEKITRCRYEQPKPQDEHENGEGVGQKIGKRRFSREQHGIFPFGVVAPMALSAVLILQTALSDTSARNLAIIPGVSIDTQLRENPAKGEA
jgi:hypothetical protein